MYQKKKKKNNPLTQDRKASTLMSKNYVWDRGKLNL